MHAATAPLLRTTAPRAPQPIAAPVAPAAVCRRMRADNAMSRHMGILLPPGVRAQMQVSNATDPAEKEADATARSVMRMDAPAPRSGRVPARLQRSALPSVMTFPAAGRAGHPARRNPAGGTEPDVEAGIRASLGGGSPLPVDVREFMEPRFRADLSGVRIHTDGRAAGLAARLGARAFAFERHIFFARGEFRPSSPAGAELIAHELTHTIQQRAVVQRSEDATVSERTTAQVQRFGVSDILDGLAELAANVPGYTLLTLIIGRNPINMRVVERNAANLLRAFMGLIPGGEILFQVLQRYGVIQRLGEWVARQTAAMGLSFQGVRDAFTRLTGSLGLRDIFDPAGVWRRAREIFTPTITRIRNFVSGLVTQAIAWLKETFTQPLADFCREIPGYGVVKVMHGRDPFTDVPEPRTALNVVRAFAEFIPGGAEKVTQLSESGALQRAYDWFLRETQARNLTWARISGTFAQAWNSLRLEDVLHPIDTLRRMVALFRPLMSDLVSFAGAALMQLLEFIYEAAMGAGGTRILAILKRARSTFLTVIRDPVRFLRHLMAGVGLGVRQFMTNILRHLRDGVIAWLAGPVARSGIQMPERWDVRGIIWFVLQILGLSWTRIRQKLVRLMGERPVALLEAGFQLLQEIRERGLVQALRDRVTEFFGNLRESALGAIRSFIQQRLVMAGITQLLSLLSPVGAIIQAIIKTYTTIQFFIQRINQILDLVEAVVDSVAAIAAGAIGQAANFVERTMARTIPVILDFLARFIGLGDVGGQVQRTIQGLQARVDQMLDRAVDWIRNQARNLASRALGGDPNATPQQRVTNGVREGTQAVNRMSGSRIGLALIRPVLAVIRTRHAMRSLEAVPEGGLWSVVGVVNPTATERTRKLVDTTTVGATRREYSPARVGFGMRASVTALNLITPQNQPTAESNAVWNVLRKRLFRAGAASYYYVRGHLINGTFGGPGGDWRNLTPLTQAANNRSVASMLSTFENPVRRAVAAGGSADITVTVTYGARGRTALAGQLRTDPTVLPGRPAAHRTRIAEIIEAEESVPTAIVTQATVTGGTAPLTIPPLTTANVIDTDLTHYYHEDLQAAGAGATARQEIDLNAPGAAAFMALAGVDAAIAARIVQRRGSGRYSDRDDFIAKYSATAAGAPGNLAVGTAVWHAMSSTAGIRLVFR